MNLGPNISTDGLVLYLDAANVDSFRGEPTTNILSNYVNPTFENGNKSGDGWTFDAKTNGSYDYYTSDKYQGVYSLRITNSTVDPIAFWRSNIPVTNGLQYTVSVYAKNINCPNIPYFSGVNISGGDHLFTGISTSEWLIFSKTYTATTTGNAQFYIRVSRNNTQGSFLIDNFQIEQKPYSTPFVNGSRGATVATGGGFADISNNNNNHAEFLASTFDSSNLGSIVFDGTDDYLSISDNPNTNLSNSNFTISFWIKVPNVSQNGPIIYKRNPNNPFDQYGISIGDTGTDSGFTTLSSKKILVILRGNNSNQARIVTEEDLIDTANGNWFKIDVVRFSNSLKIYYNGLEKNTITRRTDGVGILSDISVTGQELRVGGSNSGTFMTGQLSSVQIYNRALSADEIQQNFNATKTRFGL